MFYYFEKTVQFNDEGDFKKSNIYKEDIVEKHKKYTVEHFWNFTSFKIFKTYSDKELEELELEVLLNFKKSIEEDIEAAKNNNNYQNDNLTEYLKEASEELKRIQSIIDKKS